MRRRHRWRSRPILRVAQSQPQEVPVLSQLSEIIQACINFVPHLSLLKVTHGAVKFKSGGVVEPISPGLYWWWPLVTEVKEIPTVRQPIPLSPQTVPTADGTSLTVCGVIVFTVEDPMEALVGNWEVDDTVAEVARSTIVEVLAGKEFETLRKKLQTGDLADELRASCQKELEELGIKVEKCKLTEYAEKPLVIRTIGKGSTTFVSELEEE